MARSISCPNCGSVFELVNPGIVMLVCDHCSTRLYLSDKAAEAIGEQSILPEEDSRLYLGATGSILKHSFLAVGHIRYRHDEGFWDEWYLQLDDGKYMWLMEDERDLSLEVMTRKRDIPRPDKLVVNQPAIRTKQLAYLAQFTGSATCEGAAGQLPFVVQPGQSIGWADLATLDGNRVGTIEHPVGHRPRLFLGLPVEQSRLQVQSQSQSYKEQNRSQAMEVQCPHCSAPLPMVEDREIKTIVCEYCGTQVELSGAQAKVMGINPHGFDPEFQFEIGQQGVIDGVAWEISGRLLLSNTNTHRERMQRRYLLHNPQKEPLWLIEDGGHFYYVQSTEKQPVLDPLLLDKPRTPVEIGTDEVYKLAEAGESRVRWVDGAFPWRVSVGKTFVWANLVAPPKIFLVESDGPALRCYKGRYTNIEKVVASFKIEKSLRQPRDIHPAQLFDPGPVAKGLAWVGGFFLFVNLILWTVAWTDDGQLLWHKRLSASEYESDDIRTPLLSVFKPGVLSLMVSARLLYDDNLEVLWGIEDNNGKIILQDYMRLTGRQKPNLLDTMMERRGASVMHLLPRLPPGSYRLLVRISNDNKSGFVTLEARQGVWYGKYFIYVGALAGFFPLMLLLQWAWFDLQRWRGPSIGGYGAMDDRMARIIEQVRISKQADEDSHNGHDAGG